MEVRVLLTGERGFIGSHVLSALHARGHEAVEKNADVCLHLAWRGYAGSGGAVENFCSLTYSLGILTTMKAMGCTRFVGVGSCFEYAPSDSPLREFDPLAAMGANPFYSQCKMAFADLAKRYCDTNGISFAWARVFNVYGEDDPHPKVFPLLMRGIQGERVQLTKGEQIRDYLHVEDVASALVTLVESSVQGPVNVCSGEGLTLRHIAERLAKTHGGSLDTLEFGALPYRPKDPKYLVGNNAKLANLGWTQQHHL